MNASHRPLPTTRFAFFLPSLGGGGAERVFVTLANAIVARGFPTELCVGVADGPCARLVDRRIVIHELGEARVSRCVFSLARFLRTSRPDVLLGTMMHANLVAVLARRLARAPARLVLREAVSVQQLKTGSPLLRVCLPVLARRLYRDAASVVAVSEGVAADLRAMLGPPAARLVEVIENPLDVRFTEPARAIEAPFVPWAADCPTILAVGRLDAHKDFAMLVDAVAIVRRSRRVGLVILGEGACREALTAQAARNGVGDFLLPGYVDEPRPWFEHADVFALSSTNEGFPNVLLQALASGLPVVSTRCPSGPEELLEGGRLGRLVDVGDPDGMAAGILDALREPGDEQAGRDAAARRALEPTVDRYLGAAGVPPYGGDPDDAARVI